MSVRCAVGIKHEYVNVGLGTFPKRVCNLTTLYNRAEYSRGRRIATSKSDSRTTASCSSPSAPSPSLSDPGSEEEASEEDVGMRQPDGEGSPVERSIESDSVAPDASITSVCVPIATHSTHCDGAGAAAVGAGALSGGGAVAR